VGGSDIDREHGGFFRASPPYLWSAALWFGAMNFAEQLKQHLSPGDFARMTEWMASLPEAQRASTMQFIAARETNAPAVGSIAPDFELPLLGSSVRMRLSNFAGIRPVALIFGSYT